MSPEGSDRSGKGVTPERKPAWPSCWRRAAPKVASTASDSA